MTSDYILSILPRFIKRTPFVIAVAETIAEVMTDALSYADDIANYFSDITPDLRQELLAALHVFDRTQSIVNLFTYLQERGTEAGILRDCQALDSSISTITRDQTFGAIVGINYPGFNGSGQVDWNHNKFVVGVFDLMEIYSSIQDRALTAKIKAIIRREIVPLLVTFDFYSTPTALADGVAVKDAALRAIQRLLTDTVTVTDSAQYPTDIATEADTATVSDTMTYVITLTRQYLDSASVRDTMNHT